MRAAGYPIPEDTVQYMKRLIHDTRTRYHITLQELADQLHVDLSVVKKIESSKSDYPIELSRLKDISEIFADDFFENEYRNLVNSLMKALARNPKEEERWRLYRIYPLLENKSEDETEEELLERSFNSHRRNIPIIEADTVDLLNELLLRTKEGEKQ